MAAVEPGRYLALGGVMNPFTGKESIDITDPSNRTYFNAVWTIYVDAAGERRTRLISRARYDFIPRFPGWLIIHGLMELITFIMERRMLLGIRERAEKKNLEKRGH